MSNNKYQILILNRNQNLCNWFKNLFQFGMELTIVRYYLAFNPSKSVRSYCRKIAPSVWNERKEARND